MNDFTLERVNASFRIPIGGVVTTPAPEAVLIKNRGEFSAYLSSPERFFDGRFMLYEAYENDTFFEEHDLIAIIVRGEATLVSLERGDEAWRLCVEVKNNRSQEGPRKVFEVKISREGEAQALEKSGCPTGVRLQGSPCGDEKGGAHALYFLAVSKEKDITKVECEWV